MIIKYCQFKERINKYCTIVDSREITQFCCQIFILFFCFLVSAALYPLLPTSENHQTAIKTSRSTDVLISEFEVNKCVEKKTHSVNESVNEAVNDGQVMVDLSTKECDCSPLSAHRNSCTITCKANKPCAQHFFFLHTKAF